MKVLGASTFSQFSCRFTALSKPVEVLDESESVDVFVDSNGSRPKHFEMSVLHALDSIP